MNFVSKAAIAALISIGTAQAADITGAGSSFVAPVMSKWADAYNKATGNKINYQSVGSGAGMKQIDAKTVDFGASDAPYKPEELDAKGLVQFPVIVGGIVPVFNLPGIEAGKLRLNGPILGDIFLGNIKKWDDPAIKALNPSINLPSTAIAVVHRADGSGTSFNFTNYLSKVNPEWKAKVGEGSAPNWPLGTGGKGNEGVSAFVQRLPGAIGYVEYAYAKQSKMPYASMQNADGKFVEPDDKTFKAAAAGAQWEKNRYYVILTNQPGPDSWPIAASTFVMMHKVQDKPEQATEVLKFFDWSFSKGADMAESLDYVPLPAALVTSIKTTWSGNLKDGAGKVIAAK
jgi:phosphate transport system substrate-binding protein